jgi:hypothetical protein
LTDIVASLGGVEFHGQLLSLPAEGKGHDASLVEDGFVAIADGSTPLVTTNAIDAYGYACRALERLAQHKSAAPQEMFRLALSTDAPPREPLSHLPSSTAITLTVVQGRLTVSVLGDCLGVVKSLDGDVTVAWDRRLDKFDGPVAKQMARDVSRGMSIEEAREAAHDQLVANRDRANQPHTYWLLADDPAAAEWVEVASLELPRAEEILLCSDGLSRLIDPFRIARDAEDLLTLAGRLGLDQLGAELRAAEEAPGSFTEYPRLDPSDDATAILLRRR